MGTADYIQSALPTGKDVCKPLIRFYIDTFFSNMCNIIFILHVYDHTFMWWKGWMDGKRRRPQVDCISTFVSVKSLDILKETSGQFPTVFCGDKTH